jgi:uncharacterized small protein (DUF1192 family)
MSRTVRKLTNVDPQYDENLDKFEVVETVQTSRDVTEVCTIAECDAKIAKLQQLKAADLARWDAKIAAAEALKTEILGVA